MNDRDLDRELAQIFDVSPSPDFAAKVRRRIADAPAAGRRWVPTRWRWPLASGGAALAAVAIAAIALLPHGGERPVAPAAPEPLASQPLVAGLAGLPTASPARLPGAIVASLTGEPVIVSPEEAAGVRLLTAAALDGRITTPVFEAALRLTTDDIPEPDAIAAPDDIPIPAIVVEPLSPLTH